jgi:hypothetical protein
MPDNWKNAVTVVQLWDDLQKQYPQLAEVELKIKDSMRGSVLGRCRFGHAHSLSTLYREPALADTLVPVQIDLAAYLVDQNVDKALDTLLHETAHALAGSDAGHGPAWKAWCVELGAEPERCADARSAGLVPPKSKKGPKWRWTCPTCGVTDTRMARARTMYQPRFHCQQRKGGEPITWEQLR